MRDAQVGIHSAKICSCRIQKVIEFSMHSEAELI